MTSLYLYIQTDGVFDDTIIGNTTVFRDTLSRFYDASKAVARHELVDAAGRTYSVIDRSQGHAKLSGYHFTIDPSSPLVWI